MPISYDEDDLRAQERETFISSVSNALSIHADAAEVAEVSKCVEECDYRDQKAKRRLLNPADSSTGGIRREQKIPPLIAYELAKLPETMKIATAKGSPRGRDSSPQKRYFRIVDVGRGPLPPFELQPSLSRMDSFDSVGGGHSSFGPHPGLTDRSKEGPDPYGITERSGWLTPSATNQEGMAQFFSTFRAIPRAPNDTHARGAHQMPTSWFPGRYDRRYKSTRML